MGNKTAMGKEVMVSFSELDWGWGEGCGGVWRVGVYGGRGEGRGIREGRRGGGGGLFFWVNFFLL